jgi:hypothetical protein
MVYPSRACRAALTRKGFRPERHTAHDIYYYYHNGRRTAVWTKLSQGKSEDLRDPILKLIRGQLRLDTNAQLSDFIECPLTAEDYLRHLLDKGVLSRA